MNYKSLAVSFRIELAFHAASNEGAGGTNVMEPRRITVGDREYDGISGEIIRRHILQNFVKNCINSGHNKFHSRCRGLVPDRGKQDLTKWMSENKNGVKTKSVKVGNESKQIPALDPSNYPDATKALIENCALCDVGGYLLALEPRAGDEAQGTLKRDSCFEVGWLVTEHPAIVDYTQHSAYDPDPEKHNLYVQNMRVGIYGGVLRIDLDRICFNDWWWLAQNANIENAVISSDDRITRIKCLLTSIEQWLLSPSFAKQAAWLQHQSGLLEGAIVLSKSGPAPFFSPIALKVDTVNGYPQLRIEKNSEYRKRLTELEKAGDSLGIEEFNTPAELKDKMTSILQKVTGNSDKSQTTQPAT